MQMRIFAFLAFCCWQLNAANAKLYPIHDGNQCGYSDSSGKTAIPPQFRDCGEFSDGLAPVLADDLWGYIDEDGAIVIKPAFIEADGFSEGMAFVTIGPESKAVIDRKGKVLFGADYYRHGKFSEGLAPVYPVHQWNCFGATLEVREKCPDGKGSPRDYVWGYIDASGSMMIPPRFFGAGEFHEGLAYAGGGFIDHSANKVISGPFSDATAFADGVAAVQVDYKRWGYIDERGGWVATPQFDRAEALQEGRGLVVRDGKYGYVDRSGALTVMLQFENALPFAEGRAAVRRDGKWGFIDSSGNIVIPFQFEAAQSFQDGFATVVLDSRTAVIDKRGTPLKTQPATLAQVFQHLQGFEIKADSEGPLDQILPVLSVYKEQLRQLVADCLKAADDPVLAKSAIEAKLRKAGVRASKEEETRPYGLIHELEFIQSPLQPDLLTVLFHLKLAHAVDTSLSIFRHSSHTWDLLDKIDRNDYFKWEWDAYHIAPPQFTASDQKGAFLMLIDSDSARSGNGSYGLWVDLYRVDAASGREQLFHQLYGGKSHQIALDVNGFRLETISMEHDAARAGYRVFPYRYEIRGSDVDRVEPIGFDAHDFVGEWGNLPWDDAAKWSDANHLDRIHDYYNRLRGADGYFGGEFGVEVCDPQQRIWQVSYSNGDDEDLVWFLVERKDKWTFIVRDIGKDKRAGCKEFEPEIQRPFSTMFSKPLEW